MTRSGGRFSNVDVSAAAELFWLLSVNPGPDVSTAAAAALAGRPASQTRTVLGRLVKAHLIEPAGTGAGRWRMHDLLRLYAHQLPVPQAQVGKRERAQDRLLHYYLDGARAADAHMLALPGTPVPERFAGREQALAWLDAERPSLIAAAAMAARTGRDQIALHLPLYLSEYLDWRRRFDDKLAVLAISRDTARRLGDQANEAAALTSEAIALAEARRFDEAIAVCQDAAAIYRETGDRHREGAALNNLGVALRRVGRPEEAITAHQDAAAIFRETGDRHREGMALNNLGAALRRVGRPEEGITAHQDAAAIHRETGGRYREGMALGNLGAALREVGRLEEAITVCQDAAAIFRETGDRHREGDALNNLGVALREAGRLEEAITAHQDAAAIFRETGDEHSENGALNNLKNDQARKGS
jgi:tetratricopeptide (TPR) repeat protein